MTTDRAVQLLVALLAVSASGARPALAQEAGDPGGFWMAGGAAVGVPAGQEAGIGGFFRAGGTGGDHVGVGAEITTFSAEESYGGPLDPGPVAVRRTDIAGTVLLHPLDEGFHLKGSLGVTVVDDESGEGVPATASVGAGLGFAMPIGDDGLFLTPGFEFRLHPGLNASAVGLVTLGVGFR